MSRDLTRRSFLGLCLCAVTALLSPSRVTAFERAEHDSITETILFDKTNAKIGLSKEGKKALKALESAIQLCLDQVQQNQADLEILDKHPVYNVPKLDEISLPNINMGDHDKYTHMGWHYDYGDLTCGTGFKVQDRWTKRKRLLVDTVNTVFDFGPIDYARVRYLGWSDGTKCDALAELLYYSHVLGDFEDNIIDRTNKASNGQGSYRMDFKGINFAVKNPSDNNRDFFWDFEESIHNLFGNDAEDLIEKIDTIAKRARRTGAVNSKRTAESVLKYVKQLKQTLRKNLPELLKETDYWNQVFG